MHVHSLNHMYGHWRNDWIKCRMVSIKHLKSAGPSQQIQKTVFKWISRTSKFSITYKKSADAFESLKITSLHKRMQNTPKWHLHKCHIIFNRCSAGEVSKMMIKSCCPDYFIDIILCYVFTQMEKLRLKQLISGRVEVMDREPGLIFDVLQTSAHGEEEPLQDVLRWCYCTSWGKCHQMLKTSVVAWQRPHMSLYILDEHVLCLSRRLRNDICLHDTQEPGEDNREYHHAAYRNLVHLGQMWSSPAAVCVITIRDKYPDPNGQYTGFIADVCVAHADATSIMFSYKQVFIYVQRTYYFFSLFFVYLTLHCNLD